MKLHADRYLTERARRWELDKFIMNELPGLDLSDTMAFYQRFHEWSKDPQDRGLVAANDRFYLLTQLCKRRDAIHPWLFDRCREVEAEPDGYLDLWARFHYKSTIITFAGTIQEIIRDPEITVCIFSYVKPISAKFLSQIMKELERNEDLKLSCQDVFWHNPKRDAPSWSLAGGITVIRTSNPKEATVEAHGLDAQPTSKHFKLLVYDDVVVKKSVTNATQIAKTTENWELSDNLGVGEATRKWMPGTRYDLADTYADIIERKIVKVRMYPATHNGKLDGRPVFLSQAQWEKIKATQRKTVAAQMLQNPAAGTETYFNLAWVKGFEVRPSRVNIYIMVDPASSKKKNSDRTAMAVIAVDERKNKYLVDGFCHRMSALERWQNLRILHQKWTTMPGVEVVEVGYERYGSQSDIEWMQQRMMDKNDAYAFPIKELNTPIDGEDRKVDRISRLQPDIEGSEYRFFFPAIVWRPNSGNDAAGGMCFWSFNPDKNDFVYRPAEKLIDMGKGGYKWTGEMLLTKAQAAMIKLGEPHRNAKAIVRKDENGRLYDVTTQLFEEMRYFPKRIGHDDFLDACSRIYDMEYVGPPAGRELEMLEGPAPAH